MRLRWSAVAFGAFVAVLAVVPLVAPEFWVTLGNYIGLYSIVALGLVLLTGVAGQTSFGQAAFVGLGAYTTAYLTTKYGTSPWFTLVIGIVITAAVALFLGFITLRMKGHYLPLATIAWGMSLFYVFGNLEMLGGHTGMSGIPALSMFGFELKSEHRYFYLIWGIALASLWATNNLLDSRPGRAIRALKGGLEMAEAFGVDAARLKIVTFVYAALLACISGWLYAHLQRFVNPTPFFITQGIEYLFMAVVGGAGSVWGAVLGATLITLLKQVLQDLLPCAARPLGQFRADRVRHPDDPAAAVRARRPVAVDRAPAAAAHAAAGAAGRAAAGARPHGARRPVARRAEGAQAVRRAGGRQRPVVRDPAGRNPGADRPQRRGQEHDVQPHLRRAVADLRRRRLPRRVDRRRAALRNRAPRHRPHVPARAS